MFIFYRLSHFSANLQISEDDLKCLKRYVILLYDSSSTQEDVNMCRRELFTKKACSIDCLPPTKDALLQHAKHAVLQSG
jgi:hypothetical protein